MAWIDAIEQRADHCYAGRRDILFQPWCMLHADGVMVRQGTAEVDEALLDGSLDRIVFFQRASFMKWPESECEVQARAAVIRVREVAHDIAPHADVLECF